MTRMLNYSSKTLNLKHEMCYKTAAVEVKIVLSISFTLTFVHLFHKDKHTSKSILTLPPD